MLVINPSPNVSPYCYSLLHVEPYSSCSFRCLYCFARWYRGEKLEQQREIVEMFEKVSKIMMIKKLKPFAFRLSSFIDPFQPVENTFKLSRKVMKIALKYKVPLIVNTKAINYEKDLLETLASKNLAILQVSISVLNEKIASFLEPNAPKPIDRLDYAEKIDAPKILRLQPLIPGVSEVEDIISDAKAAGFKQVIAEVLRDEDKNMELYRRFLNLDLQDMEIYNPSVKVGRVLRPKADLRLKIYEEVKKVAKKNGLDFSVCKEPFFELNTANCCGMQYLDCALRLTLKEIREGNYENCIYGDELKKYPKAISKGLRWHEKVLIKILNKEKDNNNLIKINNK